MIIVFFLIVFISCILGVITGLGGGVIIKPVFDMLAVHDAQTVSFYSSVAVFTMCMVSVIRSLKHGTRFDTRIAFYFSMGSLVGGLSGEWLLNAVVENVGTPDTIRMVQSMGLFLSFTAILIFTFFQDRIRKYKVKNALGILIIGFVLGTIAVFLGIGGGPLNVAALSLFFSMSLKESVIYSLMNIAFSQTAKLLPLIMLGRHTAFDLQYIPAILLGALFGGYIGTRLSLTIDERNTERLCQAVMILLVILSLYNVVRAF